MKVVCVNICKITSFRISRIQFREGAIPKKEMCLIPDNILISHDAISRASNRPNANLSRRNNFRSCKWLKGILIYLLLFSFNQHCDLTYISMESLLWNYFLIRFSLTREMETDGV